MTKTSIILGASGLRGEFLLDILLEDETYSKVKIFGRSSVGKYHPKTDEHLVDMSQLLNQKKLRK